MTVKKFFTWKRVILAIAGLLVVAASWRWHSAHFPSWDEEVLLSDGRMITVHRQQKYNTEYLPIGTTLTFELPEIGKITWSENLCPAIVDVQGKDIYTVGQTCTDPQFGKYRLPRHLYVAYQLDGKNWKRIPFLSLPENIRIKENIPGCLNYSKNIAWTKKQTGWCAEKDGLWVWRENATRLINLHEQETRAKIRLRRGNGRPDAAFFTD
jgi:hypothetical protein